MESINLKISNEQKHITEPVKTTEKTPIEKAKYAKAAREFESLLTSMMLKSMTQTTDGFFGEESMGGEYFDTIFQSEISSKMSQGKGMGIAEMIYFKLTGEKLSNDDLLNLKIKPMQRFEKIRVNNNDASGAGIRPSMESLKRINRFEDHIEEASRAFGVDKNIIRSVILAESAGKESAVSTAKAKGLMQLIDSTAKDMGVRNVFDPKENIFGGTKYLSQMLRQYDGDLKLALAAYNAGPGNVDKYRGIPPFEETKNYVTRVIGYLNHLES
ncbi:MAG: transglycosylase SLT domain-containing protein [Ignavibacteriaceae bacterium]|nr:transglycosylase SLT domain-containing protein [Ignavibacteriaceae bacterium]